MEQKQCIYCPTLFTPQRSSSVICGSKGCTAKRKKEHGRNNYVNRRDEDIKQGMADKTKICAWCNHSYTTLHRYRSRSKFCGETCRAKHKQNENKRRWEQYKHKAIKKEKATIETKPDLSRGKTKSWWFKAIYFSKQFEHERNRTYQIPEHRIEALRQSKG